MSAVQLPEEFPTHSNSVKLENDRSLAQRRHPAPTEYEISPSAVHVRLHTLSDLGHVRLHLSSDFSRPPNSL